MKTKKGSPKGTKKTPYKRICDVGKRKKKKKEKESNPWKKQKYDDDFPIVDYDKFPNYPIEIIIKTSEQTVLIVNFIGYLHSFYSKRTNVHFDVRDIMNGFDPKDKKKKKILEKQYFYFKNDVRMIHLFHDHECIAEIKLRGLIRSIDTKFRAYSFFLSPGRIPKKKKK